MNLENLNKAVELKQKIDMATHALEKLGKSGCCIMVRENMNDGGILLDKSFIPELKQMLFRYKDALLEAAKEL